MLIYIIELVGTRRTYFNIPKLVPLMRIKELESLVIDAIFVVTFYVSNKCRFKFLLKFQKIERQPPHKFILTYPTMPSLSSLPSLHLLDYSTANSIEHFIQYYTFFSTVGLLMNAVRFFYYNFVTPDRKDEEIKQLRAEVENLTNVLEEVVKHLNRTRTSENYDTEKADFVDESEDEMDEKEKPAAPAEEKKDN